MKMNLNLNLNSNSKKKKKKKGKKKLNGPSTVCTMLIQFYFAFLYYFLLDTYYDDVLKYARTLEHLENDKRAIDGIIC